MYACALSVTQYGLVGAACAHARALTGDPRVFQPANAAFTGGALTYQAAGAAGGAAGLLVRASDEDMRSLGE